jgi:uncharacterized protein YeeX (DUF496 family)
MLEELRQVDTSVLDTLIDLKRERDTLRQRLARLNEAGTQVTDRVLQRVRDDYEARLADVEKRAAELKDKARENYRSLKPLRDTAQQAFEAHRLDEEEIRLRHQLGEFSEEEYRSRVAKLGEGRKNAEGRQAEIAELVARFVGAFDSPEDLDPESLGSGAIPAAASPSSSQDDEHTWVTPSAPPAPPPAPPAEEAAGEAEPSAASAADEDSRSSESPDTVSSSPIASATDAPPRPQRRASAAEGASALLHALDGDVEPSDHPLEELTFVGRTPENQVRIYKPAVSRRHAQIARTATGWLLRDLSSENGTYVNGQRITERLLADGDRVQFGTSRFIFKAG